MALPTDLFQRLVRWSRVSALRSLPALVALALLLPAAFAPAGPSASGTCWVPPVSAPVVDPFRRPECPWCPGKRGLEYGTGPGAPVRAVASGIVTFSGWVARTGYVVVRHADGIRATYGGVTAPFRAQGSFVPAGAIVGITDRNLHFGLRDEIDYVDPTPFIGRIVLRAHLLPLDGTPPRRGASRLVCPRRSSEPGAGPPDRLRSRFGHPSGPRQGHRPSSVPSIRSAPSPLRSPRRRG